MTALHATRSLDHAPSPPAWRAMFIVCALLVAYGNLYPLHFAAPASYDDALQALLSNVTLWTSTSDVAGNVVLFVPLGAIGVATLGGARWRVTAHVALFIAMAGFALSLQWLQIFVPGRSASLADAFWNVAGLVAGMSLSLAVHAPIARRALRLPPRAWLPVALVAAWLWTQLLPLVPTLDWQQVKDSLKPLLLQPQLDEAAAIFTAARVMAVAVLLECIVLARRGDDRGADRQGEHPARGASGTVGLLVAGVLMLKPFIVNQRVMPSHVAGYAAGYAAWLLARTPQRRRVLAFVALWLGYTVSALAPLEWRATPSTFSIVPFASLLEGAMAVNAWALAELFFVFGTLLWLVRSVGGSVRGMAVALALWVGALEVAQMWIVSRTPDVTPALLVLALGYALGRSRGVRP